MPMHWECDVRQVPVSVMARCCNTFGLIMFFVIVMFLIITFRVLDLDFRTLYLVTDLDVDALF